ncbi:hypothetical protein C8R44DRAFT_749139 [Mycena epipterygia]|nr:hypothetical protein C8R44DRAFT_749139 [Mycena epipterygia]
MLKTDDHVSSPLSSRVRLSSTLLREIRLRKRNAVVGGSGEGVGSAHVAFWWFGGRKTQARPQTPRILAWPMLAGATSGREIMKQQRPSGSQTPQRAPGPSTANPNPNGNKNPNNINTGNESRTRDTAPPPPPQRKWFDAVADPFVGAEDLAPRLRRATMSPFPAALQYTSSKCGPINSIERKSKWSNAHLTSVRVPCVGVAFGRPYVGGGGARLSALGLRERDGVRELRQRVHSRDQFALVCELMPIGIRPIPQNGLLRELVSGLFGSALEPLMSYA